MSKDVFESSLKELEEIVQQLEAQDLPLEKAMALFERGTVLSSLCQKTLGEAEEKIEALLSQIQHKKTTAET